MLIERAWVVNPKEFKEDYDLHIQHHEPPVPGGHFSRKENHELKLKMNELYPRKEVQVEARSGSRSTDSMRVMSGFPADYFINNLPLTGGTPNDNTLAISDGGNLLISWNTRMWGYDLQADTHLFTFPNKHPSFTQFIVNHNDTAVETLIPFDPKLVYDPVRDRFIMVFLEGDRASNNTQDLLETTNAIVCFSSSSDPSDLWYAYALEGNPLNYDTWTDYPQIAINENSFYLTLNQLYPDSGWVEGFAETVLWQMDLDAAFAGNRPVPTKFWTGFTHEGKNIRYLHPVKSAMGPEGDDMYFVANRPFTVTNDTFFLVHVDGDANDPNTNIDVQLLSSSLTYGHPPYAKQSGNDQEFWTNDARVLGAVKNGDQIQFTGNSIDVGSGRATIYHGIIEDVNNPSVTGSIIVDPDKELGFPNIAFAGVSASDRETAIFVNHTGENVLAGNSVIYYNQGNYSHVQTVKEGEGYVDMFFSDDQERWGDYVGVQRKFNETSRIWVSGYYGMANNRAATWIAELGSPKDGPAGVDDAATEPKVQVFPNPVMDYVRFDFNLESSTNAEVLLHDLSGKQVARLGNRHIQAGDNSLTFDAATLPSGFTLFHCATMARYSGRKNWCVSSLDSTACSDKLFSEIISSYAAYICSRDQCK